MGRRNRGKLRLLSRIGLGGRTTLALLDSGFSEYQPFGITAPVSRAKRLPAWRVIGVAVTLGGAIGFALARQWSLLEPP